MINRLLNSFSTWLFRDLKEDIPASQRLHEILNRLKSELYSSLTPQEISTYILNYPVNDKDEMLAQLLVMMHFHEGRIIELENKIKELTNGN